MVQLKLTEFSPYYLLPLKLLSTWSQLQTRKQQELNDCKGEAQ